MDQGLESDVLFSAVKKLKLQIMERQNELYRLPDNSALDTVVANVKH